MRVLQAPFLLAQLGPFLIKSFCRACPLSGVLDPDGVRHQPSESILPVHIAPVELWRDARDQRR